MKKINIEKLTTTDYNVKFFNYIEQFWKSYKTFNCFNKPKKYDLILYLNDCEAIYTTKSGRKIHAKSNDIVYTPMNSEYSVEFFNFTSEHSSTLQINFFVYDKNYEQIKLCDDDVKIFSPSTPLAIKELFQKIGHLSFDLRTPPTQNKSILFDILNSIANNKPLGTKPSPISAGLDYLHLHYFENPSITMLAKKCYMSNEYFRKIFKKQTGLTPSEYRNKLRLDKSKEYLKFKTFTLAHLFIPIFFIY